MMRDNKVSIKPTGGLVEGHSKRKIATVKHDDSNLCDTTGKATTVTSDIMRDTPASSGGLNAGVSGKCVRTL